jgi:hypothetical protein
MDRAPGGGLFRYWHGDISIKFSANRPTQGAGHNWINYDPENKMTDANFALGPVCQVFIDDRQRRLSAEEKKAVQEMITVFLLGAYRPVQPGDFTISRIGFVFSIRLDRRCPQALLSHRCAPTDCMRITTTSACLAT